jgi:hypothetical protein
MDSQSLPPSQGLRKLGKACDTKNPSPNQVTGYFLFADIEGSRSLALI